MSFSHAWASRSMRTSLDALPSTPRFFLDYVQNWEKVDRFFCHHHSLEAVSRFARQRAEMTLPHRGELAAALGRQQARWGGSASAAEKLASGAVAVVTGQQAGLFTGPLYAVLKALTAVKLARFLEDRGIAALPVFWIASDDHDHQEIEWAALLDRDSVVRRVRAQVADGTRTPAGWLRFGDDIERTLAACFECLPESEFAAEVRSEVSAAYAPGVSPVDAFGSMMTRLFSGTPLVLVDPLDPSMRELCGEVLATAAERVEDVRAGVLERTRTIREAGYPEQVHVDESFTGLFAINGTSRDGLDSLDRSVSSSSLSPNVLLRPVVQDALLPTASYVGGPAEIAYLAQAGAIYDVLNVPMPPVFPRISATLVEPPVARILKKYDLGVEDVFSGENVLRSRMVSQTHDAEIFDEVRGEIEAQAERLRPVLGEVDQTLNGALDNSIQKIRHQVNTLQSRFVNAEARRNEVLDRQLATLTNRLFPEKKLQERVVNVTSFLVRYGWNLASLMDSALQLDGTTHQIVEL
jgi:uncharacterized protein YllA (UPF0747 family)